MNDTISMHSEDRKSLDRKLQVVKDHVAAVALGFKFGLYLYGQGGIGKSFSVLHQLEQLNASVILYNSRMTGKGLFNSLRNAPDAIHVLEDMERLTKDPDAQAVLRSALWAPPGRDRTVTWTTASEGEIRFTFRGGLILIGNRPLFDMPELRALATRIEVHHLEVTEVELIALMRELAVGGYRVGDKLLLAPEECLQVTELLIKECRMAGCPLDLRLQQKGFQTYRQWESGNSVTRWDDLLAASVREATHHFRHEADTAPREQKMARKRNALREIMAQTGDAREQEELYRKRMNTSRADFFRRKSEILSREFNEQDDAA